MPWQDFCGWLPHEWWLGRTWEGAFLLYQYSVVVVVMDLDGWVDGRVTSPRIGSMDSVQVGKAVFVKVSFASLGFEPRTFSYPGSCATNTLLAKKFSTVFKGFFFFAKFYLKDGSYKVMLIYFMIHFSETISTVPQWVPFRGPFRDLAKSFGSPLGPFFYILGPLFLYFSYPYHLKTI